MVFYILLSSVIFCIAMSLRTLFLPNTLKGKLVSLENFLFLAFLYATIMIGFGLIYILFEFNGNAVILENGRILQGDFFKKLETSIYFSTITLFSVGYGDIVPVGIGRTVVVLEALVGYTIPAAFVAKAVLDGEK
ncbi:ion channel [Bacillus methanolicus]|uniref:Ion transport protein n=1 Tax=Bacillus methanolicus (strain MGA3 / ATCC 53907) TaxID=796606 RepID=I3E2L5_BACMM|nr:ion channel [Bacillus methanolicus]AIE59161.1 Ion transport protein [Bacillus methanolicus MGA3]EIJ80736.1 Ion transport protein [Bacillus methanolicus MGA3]UQD51231.1 two pore domain potassium channel family protein [Bacillus methanolicus]